MSEQEANKRNGHEQTVREQWLSVKEAAALLGITERGVQLRAKRGKIASKREAGLLQVCLTKQGEQGEQNEQSEDSRTENEQNVREQTNNALVEQLKSENAFLRAQMERLQQARTEEISRRDQAEGELRKLLLIEKQELQELRQRLAIAPPPVQETSGRAQDGTASEKGAGGGKDTGTTRRGWFARLFGRKG